MFRFTRTKILPLFLATNLGLKEFAKLAGVASGSAYRGINGLPISAKIVMKLATALNISAVDYLEPMKE